MYRFKKHISSFDETTEGYLCQNKEQGSIPEEPDGYKDKKREMEGIDKTARFVNGLTINLGRGDGMNLFLENKPRKFLI